MHNVTEIEPGHQCYKIDQIPSSVTAGTNATIQLEYWATYPGENSGKNESFYACADVVCSIPPLPSFLDVLADELSYLDVCPRQGLQPAGALL